MRPNTPVDVARLIDTGALSRYQIWTVVLCALVAFLDGYNTQAIGAAGRALAQSLHASTAALAPVFSASLLGAMVGAIAFGPLADRYGRKRVLIVAVLLFAAFTFVTARSDTWRMLLIARLLAGLGLGGATPCFIALTTEYAPARVRSFAIAVMWAAFPTGGLLGGLINPLLIDALGWRSLFYWGGAASLLLCLLLAAVLPESLRYLIAVNAPRARIRRIIARLAPGLADAELRIDGEPMERDPRADGSRERGSHGVIVALATVPALPTLLLWVVFFSSFLILVFTPLWAPVLLAQAGILSARQAAFIVAANNLGSAIGTAGFGLLLDRFAAQGVLIPVFGASALLTAGIGVFAPASFAAASACALLAGLGIGGGSAGAISLAAALYPTRARSTGIGLAMAIGRLGQVIGPLIAGALLSRHAGPQLIFSTIAGFAVLAALCVWQLAAQSHAVPHFAAASELPAATSHFPND